VKAELPRFALHEIAKADTLHVASDDGVQSLHGLEVTRLPIGKKGEGRGA